MEVYRLFYAGFFSGRYVFDSEKFIGGIVIFMIGSC